MKIVLISDVDLKAKSRLYLNTKYLEKASLNDLSSDFMKKEKIKHLILVQLGEYKERTIFLLKQFRMVYPEVIVTFLYSDYDYVKELQAMNLNNILYVPQGAKTSFIVKSINSLLINQGSLNLFPLISYKSIYLDPNNRKVTVDGYGVQLGKTEFNLLELFLMYPYKVFTKAELMDIVWNYRFDMNSHTVEVHLAKLRKKLKQVSGTQFFETIYGKGYRLV
jgi:DNA-binding response OmpR family regulator